MLKRDVEYCLKTADSWDRFEKQLNGLGYTIDWTRMSVTAKGWERAVRLDVIGYLDNVLEKRLKANYYNLNFTMSIWYTHQPLKTKTVLLSKIARQLEFSIDHSHDAAEIWIDLMFLVLIRTFRAFKAEKDAVILSVDLRHTVKDLTTLIEDHRFLQTIGLQTIPQLDRYIEDTQTEITELERERGLLRNKVRRETDPAVLADNRAARSEITKNHIEPLRKNLKRAQKIKDKSPHLYELLKDELQREAPFVKTTCDGQVIMKSTPDRGAR